jgi:AbrB family looped-hinge helix DNA binding protein
MLEYRTHVREGGRIVIPVEIRKKLQLEIGEEVILKLEDHELHVVTLKNAILKAQQMVQKYNKSNKKLTEELFKLRKEDND